MMNIVKLSPVRMLLLVLIAIGICLTGCTPRETPTPPQPSSEEEQQESGEKKAAEKIVLYFAGPQAESLVQEEREVECNKKDLKIILLEELVKGPQNPELGRTIPQGVKIIGVSGEGEIAVANFSEELRSGHWGGSTGELLTVYSIVNTLAELPGVKKVKFLIEGRGLETLAGHMDLTEPIAPDWNMVKK